MKVYGNEERKWRREDEGKRGRTRDDISRVGESLIG